MKSEFLVLELADRETEWLRELLANVPLWGKLAPPISLPCDHNQASIALAHNSARNGKRRHIWFKAQHCEETH